MAVAALKLKSRGHDLPRHNTRNPSRGMVRGGRERGAGARAARRRRGLPMPHWRPRQPRHRAHRRVASAGEDKPSGPTTTSGPAPHARAFSGEVDAGSPQKIDHSRNLEHVPVQLERDIALVRCPHQKMRDAVFAPCRSITIGAGDLRTVPGLSGTSPGARPLNPRRHGCPLCRWSLRVSPSSATGKAPFASAAAGPFFRWPKAAAVFE